MVVTLFDLDHTLLPLDTNQAWISFLCDAGALDAGLYQRAALAMKQRYLAGGDDPDIAFCEFFIGTLSLFEPAHLLDLRAQFVTRMVLPAIDQRARNLVDLHRAQGDVLVIITATNQFITAPVAQAFGIEHLIATECERVDDRFTGRVSGIPSMRSGKVTRLDAWLSSEPVKGLSSRRSIDQLRFYSDSINDRALLEQVDLPIAVDPDHALALLADERGWPVIELNQPRPR
jgi:HAD superfamily hydrolase (TIGR01490 family)